MSHRSLLPRLLILLGLFYLPASLGYAQPNRGFALTDGSGPTAVTAAWVYFPPQAVNRDPGGYLLRIDTSTVAVPVQVVGQALDRLLDRSSRRQPLPADFQVRLGAARAGLEDELQRRLHLSHDHPDLKRELAAIIDRSAIATAFRRHRYALRLDEIGRITQDSPGARPLGSVPIHIDEIALSAHRIVH